MQKLEISVRTSQKWNQVQTKSVRPPSSPSYPRLLSVNCWILKKNLDCCCQLSVSWQEQRTYLGREEGVDDEDKRLQRKRLIIVATKRESQINIALSFAFNWQFSPNYFWKELFDVFLIALLEYFSFLRLRNRLYKVIQSESLSNIIRSWLTIALAF